MTEMPWHRAGYMATKSPINRMFSSYYELHHPFTGLSCGSRCTDASCRPDEWRRCSAIAELFPVPPADAIRYLLTNGKRINQFTASQGRGAAR